MVTPTSSSNIEDNTIMRNDIMINAENVGIPGWSPLFVRLISASRATLIPPPPPPPPKNPAKRPILIPAAVSEASLAA